MVIPKAGGLPLSLASRGRNNTGAQDDPQMSMNPYPTTNDASGNECGSARKNCNSECSDLPYVIWKRDRGITVATIALLFGRLSESERWNLLLKNEGMPEKKKGYAVVTCRTSFRPRASQTRGGHAVGDRTRAKVIHGC